MNFSRFIVNSILLLLLLVLLALPVTSFGILGIDPSFRSQGGNVAGMMGVRVQEEASEEENGCSCPCESTSSYSER